jgi:hypothetical protein
MGLVAPGALQRRLYSRSFLQSRRTSSDCFPLNAGAHSGRWNMYSLTHLHRALNLKIRIYKTIISPVVAQDKDKRRALVNAVMNLRVP